MKRISRTTLLWMFLFSCIFLIFNFLTPLFADDWNNLIYATDDTVQSIGDALKSGKNLYLYWSGRVIPHVVIQIFNCITGKAAFNVVNSIVFFFYLFAVLINVTRQHGISQSQDLFLLAISTFLILPGFSRCCLWLCGACNYMWVGVAVLTFNYLLQRRFKKSHYPWLFLLGLICGWSNEGIVMGFALAYVIFVIHNRKRISGSQKVMLTGFYLDLYKLQNQQQVIAKNIELTEKVIEQMRARREQGTVLKNDLTRYELQLQSLLLTKTQLDDAQKIIRHQISTAIHLPEGEDFEVDTQSLEEEGIALKALTSEELWQQTAAENSIDIRQASLATEMSEQKIRNTRAASRPSVAVVAENNLAGPYTSDLIPKDANVNVWFVGIGVKYNLSSLWKNKHAIRKAKHENIQAREQVQLAREGVENGVQACYTNLLTSSVEVSTQEKQVELADQNYAVVRNRYDNDLALLTDMLDASNMKLSADMALVNARINMLYNYFKLKYITNTL